MRDDGILILGGTGFLGSALARELKRHTDRPIHIYARHAKPHPDYIVHQAHLENLTELRRALTVCSTVIHAISGTTPSTSSQLSKLETALNIAPTLGLLDCLMEDAYSSPAKQLLFISSGGTFYGNAQKPTMSEDDHFAPLSFYGAGKVALEAFLHAFSHHSPHQVITVRPSNVYGPGQVVKPGFGFIATLIEHARQQRTLDVWGDGETVRDFIYLSDFVHACRLLLQQANAQGAYHIAYGQGVTLNQVIAQFENVSGIKLNIRYSAARQVDVKRIVLDTSRLRTLTGWTPQIDLATGLKQTWFAD